MKLLGFVCVCLLYKAKATIEYASPDDHGYYSDGAPYETYMSDWNKDWAMLSGRFHPQPKCVDIPANLSLCRDIGYQQMRLPNLLDHDTISEVTSQAASWGPLLGIRCHPDTKLFLCSLFSPVCLERTIWPCRSLCEDVKNSCEGFMNKYGFPWPEMLRCNKFPLDNDLCIGLQNHNKPDDTVCEPCNKPETFEGILDNFCSAEFVMRIKVQENVVSAGDMKVTPQRKKRAYKKGNLSKRDLRSLTFYIENGEHCDCSILENNKKLMVMGRKEGDKLKLTYVTEYDKSNKDLKRALRAFRQNENICEDINILTVEGKKKAANRNDGDDNADNSENKEVANNGNNDNGNNDDGNNGNGNSGNNDNDRKERRRKKGKGNKNRNNNNNNDDNDNDRKERRKGKKRNKGNRDNSMTREERRRRREDGRQLRQLGHQRKSRTFQFQQA